MFTKLPCADIYTFSQRMQNEFSACKEARRGAAAASPREANAADGSSGKSFGEV